MRTRTTTRTVAAATLALAVGLAACGDDDDDASEATAAADVTDAVDATAGPATTSAAPSTTGAAATAATAAPDATSAAGEGFEYLSPDGSYAVTYPAEPTERSQDQLMPGGSTIPVTFVLYTTATEGYVSAVTDYGSAVDADLDGAVEGSVTNIGATLLDQQVIELGGREGRQYVGDVSGQGTVIGRVFADGSRLWQVIFTGAGEISPDDPRPAAFLASFRFTDGGG